MQHVRKSGHFHTNIQPIVFFPRTQNDDDGDDDDNRNNLHLSDFLWPPKEKVQGPSLIHYYTSLN